MPKKEKKYVRRWYGRSGWETKTVLRGPGGTLTVRTPAGDFQVKESRHQKGCFTLQNLANKQLVGVYSGRIINERQLALKLSKIAKEKQPFVSQYLVQSHLHSTPNSNCYLDPTNDHGALDPSWSENPVLYCNEPDPDQTSNLMGVWNYDVDRLELWARRDICIGEELLVNYGQSFDREYSTGGACSVMMFKEGVLQAMA